MIKDGSARAMRRVQIRQFVTAGDIPDNPQFIIVIAELGLRQTGALAIWKDHQARLLHGASTELSNARMQGSWRGRVMLVIDESRLCNTRGQQAGTGSH